MARERRATPEEIAAIHKRMQWFFWTDGVIIQRPHPYRLRKPPCPEAEIQEGQAAPSVSREKEVRQ